MGQASSATDTSSENVLFFAKVELSAIRNGDQDIPARQHAEVTVEPVGRMEKK